MAAVPPPAAVARRAGEEAESGRVASPRAVRALSSPGGGLAEQGVAAAGHEWAGAAAPELASRPSQSSSKARARMGLGLDDRPAVNRSQSSPRAGLGGDYGGSPPLSDKARRKMGLSLDGLDEGAGGTPSLSDKARRKMGLSLDGLDECADGASLMIRRSPSSPRTSPRSVEPGGGHQRAAPPSVEARSKQGPGEDESGGGDIGGSEGDDEGGASFKALGLLGLGLSDDSAVRRREPDVPSHLIKALARLGVNDSAGVPVLPSRQRGVSDMSSQGRQRGSTGETLSGSSTEAETEEEQYSSSSSQRQLLKCAPEDRAAFEGAPLFTRPPAMLVFSSGGLRHRLRCGVLEQLGDSGQWTRLVVMGELSAATRCENALRLWRHSHDVVTLYAQTRAEAEAWRSAIVAHAVAWAPARPAGLALRPIILSNLHPLRDNAVFGFGDVLLFKIPRFSANVQRFLTNSEWDHVGVVVPIEWGVSFQFGDFAAERWALLEATPEGVISCPLAARVRQYLAETGARACVRHLDGPLDRDGVDNLRHLVTCATGRPYSYRKMVQTGESGHALPYNRAEHEKESEQGYFCSYLCALALLSLNVIDTGRSWPSNAYWPVSFTYGDAIDRHLRPAFALSPPLEVDVD
jgi:hypothetical protein